MKLLALQHQMRPENNVVKVKNDVITRSNSTYDMFRHVWNPGATGRSNCSSAKASQKSDERRMEHCQRTVQSSQIVWLTREMSSKQIGFSLSSLSFTIPAFHRRPSLPPSVPHPQSLFSFSLLLTALGFLRMLPVLQRLGDAYGF